VSPGALTFRVVSEAASLRPMVEERLGWATRSGYGREGLLVGRPGAGTSSSSAAWILYESGDVVLRRSRSERDVVDAALFHLGILEAAINSPLLPLRLRTVVLPDGTALLVDPRALNDVAGHDRWFRAHGCGVLPTTVALVDPVAEEVLLPPQDVDPLVPSGRIPIDQILLREPQEAPMPGAARLLALSAVVLRDPDRDLQVILDQLAQLASARDDLVQLLPRSSIAEAVKQRGVRPST
jgi:hypothetical protein